MPAAKNPGSDTVSVTSDGRLEVDLAKLLKKPHIQRMFEEIRSKTKYVTVAREGASAPVEPHR